MNLPGAKWRKERFITCAIEGINLLPSGHPHSLVGKTIGFGIPLIAQFLDLEVSWFSLCVVVIVVVVVQQTRIEKMSNQYLILHQTAACEQRQTERERVCAYPIDIWIRWPNDDYVHI